MEAAPSRTAMLAALARGLLRMEETPPWVLDDAFALLLIGPAWQDLRELTSSLFPAQVLAEAAAAVCTRTRYVEDRLAAGGFAQYVILGAGLDSFAWRRPELLGSLRVFEVDHPASQAWKLERVKELALPLSDAQVLVPIDLRPSLFRRLCAWPGSSGASRRCSPGPALPPISPRRRSRRRCARPPGLRPALR